MPEAGHDPAAAARKAAPLLKEAVGALKQMTDDEKSEGQEMGQIKADYKKLPFTADKIKDAKLIQKMDAKTETTFDTIDKNMIEETDKALKHETKQDKEVHDAMKTMKAAAMTLRESKASQGKPSLGDSKGQDEWAPIDSAIKQMKSVYDELKVDAKDHTSKTELQQMRGDESKIEDEEKKAKNAGSVMDVLKAAKKHQRVDSLDAKALKKQLEQFVEINQDDSAVAKAESLAAKTVNKFIQKLD